MARGPVLVLVQAAMAIGCQQNAVDDLEAEAKRLAGKLETLRGEIAQAERLAEAARRRAEEAKCRAEASRLRAAINAKRADCLFEVARHSECKATRQQKKGDVTLLGCGAGLVFAVASGGSATPWALAGCAGGRAASEVSQAACPTPACAERLAFVESDVLVEAGLQSLPFCGGFLGASLREGRGHRPFGAVIGGVRRGSTADALGLQQGDVIVSIAKQRLVTIDSLSHILQKRRYGELIDVSFVRNDQLLQSQAQLVPLDGVPPPAGAPPILGVENLDSRGRTEFRWGVVVERLEADGPAQAAGLRAGDHIIGLDGAEVVRPAEVAERLHDTTGGQKIAFRVERRQGYKTIEVLLDERGDRKGL